MFIIDTKSRVPVHEQLQAIIVKYVSAGILSPDEQLPSVRAMAQELGINPNTVQKAYKILEEHKVVYTIPGRGAFVAEATNSLDIVKEIAANKFKESVKQAKDTSFSKNELVELIDEVYGREGQIND